MNHTSNKLVLDACQRLTDSIKLRQQAKADLVGLFRLDQKVSEETVLIIAESFLNLVSQAEAPPLPKPKKHRRKKYTRRKTGLTFKDRLVSILGNKTMTIAQIVEGVKAANVPTMSQDLFKYVNSVVSYHRTTFSRPRPNEVRLIAVAENAVVKPNRNFYDPGGKEASLQGVVRDLLLRNKGRYMKAQDITSTLLKAGYTFEGTNLQRTVSDCLRRNPPTNIRLEPGKGYTAA